MFYFVSPCFASILSSPMVHLSQLALLVMKLVGNILFVQEGVNFFAAITCCNTPVKVEEKKEWFVICVWVENRYNYLV